MNRKVCGYLLVITSVAANGLLTVFRVHHPYSDLILAVGMLGIVLSTDDKRLSLLAALGGVLILLFALLGIYNWWYGVTLLVVLLAVVAVLVYDKMIRKTRLP